MPRLDPLQQLRAELDARITAATNYSAQLKIQLDDVVARLAILERDHAAPKLPVYDATASVTPTEVAAGATVRLNSTFKCDQSTPNVIIDIELYDADGNCAFKLFRENQDFTAGAPISFIDVIPMPKAPSIYTFKFGIFSFDWVTIHYWNGNAASVTVSAANDDSIPTIPPPRPPTGTIIDANVTTLPGLSHPTPIALARIKGEHPNELRIENIRANATPPTGLLQPYPIEPQQFTDEWYKWDYHLQYGGGKYYQKVSGDAGGFGLTTWEILEWAALKWGFDNLSYEGKSLKTVFCAMAVCESWWRQSAQGDKNADTGEFDSFGILQMRRPYYLSAFESRLCTALNADLCAAQLRARYDGAIEWLGSGTKGNILYSIGAHQSGQGYGQHIGAPASSRPTPGSLYWNTYIDAWIKYFNDEPWRNSVGKEPYWF